MLSQIGTSNFNNTTLYGSANKTNINNPCFAGSDEVDKDINSNLQEDENPIKFGFELLNAMGKSIVSIVSAGIVWSFYDGGDLLEALYSQMKKFSKAKAAGLTFAALLGIGLIGFFIKLPETYYNAKVKTFEKRKNVDVYLKNNKLEKDIFETLDKQGQEAKSSKEIKNVASNFMKVSANKQQAPNLDY